MLEFIKKQKILRLITFIFIIGMMNGCDIVDENDDTYKFFNFKESFQDEDGSLILKYQYNFSQVSSFVKLNTNTNLWDNVTKAESPLNKDKIVFESGQTKIVDENGSVTFELTPPSISEIENRTGISLPKAMVVYNLFRDGIDYSWDRATYIANIGIEKEKENDKYTFTEVHCFSLVYSELGNWDITYIGKKPDLIHETKYYEADLNISYFNADISSAEYYYHNPNSLVNPRLSIDGSFSLCHKWAENNDIRCFEKDNDNRVELKILYGEILPIEFKDVLMTLYNTSAFRLPSPSAYIFDKDKNMHIFYNDANTAKGKYFYYKMYLKENPTTPLYEQKIPWK